MTENDIIILGDHLKYIPKLKELDLGIIINK